MVSPGHLINTLSFPSSMTLIKGVINISTSADPSRTAHVPWGLTATLNHLIIVWPTLGFLAYYKHVMGGSTKSLTQLKRSSFFKDFAMTMFRLLSIQISKLVTVVLPEASHCYFAVFPSSFPPKHILWLHGRSSPSCILSPVLKHRSQELARQPYVVLNLLTSRRQGRQNPTFFILHFQWA